MLCLLTLLLGDIIATGLQMAKVGKIVEQAGCAKHVCCWAGLRTLLSAARAVACFTAPATGQTVTTALSKSLDVCILYILHIIHSSTQL